MFKRLFAAMLSAALFGVINPNANAHHYGGSSVAGNSSSTSAQEPCNSCPCEGPGSGAAPGILGPETPAGRTSLPISFFNGGESVMYTDLRLSGEFPIAIIRKYDSQTTFDSPVGAGWVFLLDRRLYEYPDGSIIVRHGCGSRDKYVFSGGAYVSPAGGMLGTLTATGGGTYELRYVNGTTDFFDNLGRLTSVRDSKGNRHEYSYDSRGKLPLIGTAKSSVDPTQPITIAYVYRITRIDERGAGGTLTGRYVTFQYNETTGRLMSVTANDGRSVSYVQDTAGALTKGNLTQVNMLDGQVATYGYTDANDAHNLTSIADAAGRTPTVNVYDAQDRVITQTEGDRKIEFNYQTPLVKTIVTKTIKDQNGLNPYIAVTTYEFDETGRITKITTPLGHEERFTYSPAKRLTKKEIWQYNGGSLALLQTRNWSYDSAGRMLTESVTLDAGETITRTRTYDHDWVATEQVVSTAAPIKIFRTEYTFFYGADGRPTAIASEKRRKDDGSFRTTSYTYDTRDRLLTTTLPDGIKLVRTYTGDFVTKIAYEVSGAEIGSMKRLFDYDSQGNSIKKWDARNNLTQYGYDNRGRLISTTNPLAQQNLYTYTNDLLTQIEVGKTVADGEGQVSKLIYDTRGRLTTVQRKDDSGVFQTFQSFALDSEGQRLSITDALSRTTTFGYDLSGRLTSTKDALNKTTSFGYDAAGNRTSVTDALNRLVNYEYDDLNRQTAMVEAGVSPSPRTEYSYDAAGNLTSVKDGENRTTAYVYDSLSRNTTVTQPLGQQTQFFYDSRDRVDYLVNARGNKLDYGYETWGPIKEEKQYVTTSSSTPTRTIAYAFDLDGNVSSVVDDAVQTTPTYALTYDQLGRLYDETAKFVPGGDRVLNHRYDRYGNRNTLTFNDGTALTNSYLFDKRNRLTAATLVGTSVSVGYFGNDDRQTVTLPGSVTRSYTYKANGPIDTITVTGTGGQLGQYAYAYDDVLNVDTLTTTDGVHDYGYDALNRLTSAVHPTGLGLSNEAYAYDKVGNREDPGNAALYAYDGNHRITNSPTSLTYTFDADGSVATRSDGTTYTHDYRSRLTQFVKGATTATYLYDALGRRIRKTVNGTATWFLWDGGRLLAEFNASGTRTQRYSYLGSDYAPTQVQDANGTFYVHADHLEAPRLATNGSGVVIWKAKYEAFGKAAVDADPDGNTQLVTLNLRFPGQYADIESGTYYNYFRDYDPATGRYLQSDPLGVRIGNNTYGYSNQSPTGWTDPRGLDCSPGALLPRDFRQKIVDDSKPPETLHYPAYWLFEQTQPGVALGFDRQGRSNRGTAGPAADVVLRWYWFVWLKYEYTQGVIYSFLQYQEFLCIWRRRGACGNEWHETETQKRIVDSGYDDSNVVTWTELVYLGIKPSPYTMNLSIPLPPVGRGAR
jgi:RHS repeat-associated protein